MILWSLMVTIISGFLCDFVEAFAHSLGVGLKNPLHLRDVHVYDASFATRLLIASSKKF